MSDGFCSLHTHTSYSQLDGASKIPQLVDRAVELGMDSLGVSDHGNLNGLIDFYRECKKKGIKPVLGQEFYFADDRLVKEKVSQQDDNGQIDGSDKRYYHLSIWAENQAGYQNLLKLSSDAFLNGMYYKPRTDYGMLSDHAEGLMVGSGCLGGPVLQKLLHDDYMGGLAVASNLQDIVGRENFFIEMMNHDLPEQRKTNPMLMRIAKQINAPLICTQDTHYTHKEDAHAHDVLLCCQTGSKQSDEKRFRFHNNEYYLKSAEQMRDLFAEAPEACDNTLFIAERVDVEIDFDTLHLPAFKVPAGFDDDNHFLEHLVMEGLEKRYDTPSQQHFERAAYELSVIKSLNLSSYFLIFWDLVEFANRERILTGPGRGSAAGSIVSYSLGITKVDPIRHGLIFERFINPSRIALADIDWDIDTRYRDKLINYVSQKYGEDHVAQIITFGIIKARTAVRDAARVLGYEWSMGDKIAKLMPPLIMGVDTPLYACFSHEEKYDSGYKNAQGLRELYRDDPKAKDIIDTALGLEGLHRQDGIHAAGVVIGDSPLTEIVPVQRKGDDKPIVTQWSKNIIEDLGLLKMDFLGLRNLDVISDTLDRLDLPFDYLENINFNDGKTLDLLRRGETIGVFQVESAPMRELLRNVLPTDVEDISAVLALYRPGPMSTNMHYDYADRKNGRDFAIPFHPDAEPILKETYQLSVYQEQVMDMARTFAGYSMAEADNLRKIMGKKLPDKMKAEKGKFVDGCIAQGYDKDFAEELFDKIEGFSNYGFNKSHSVSYAYITYWTAYLKANHPLEYMASICSSIMDDLNKTAVALYETRRMGYKIYSPDINLAGTFYTVEEDGIRIGLNTVRNVGREVAEGIIRSREEGGKFLSLYDFCKRINPNLQVLKSLAHAGALDSFGSRLGTSSVAEDVLKSVRKELKKNAKNQGSLFDNTTALDIHIPETEFAWSQLLEKEKDALGIYASGHPLDDYDVLKTEISVSDLLETETDDRRQRFDLVVLVSKLDVKYTKKGEAMATVTLEDQTGSFDAVAFPRTWKEYRSFVQAGKIIKVSVNIGTDFRDQKNYILQEAESLISEDKISDLVFGVFVPEKFNSDPGRMSKLKGVLLSHHGNVPVKVFKSRSAVIKLDHEYTVKPSNDLKKDVVALFREYNLTKGKVNG